MNDDYTNLYGAPKSSAPPQPASQPQSPSPYNRDISGAQPEEPPKPYVFHSSDAGMPSGMQAPAGQSPAPFPMNAPNPYQYAQRPAPQPKPAKPKQPFSPIPLLLMAGVTFLFLGGIVFLTSTWASLADMIRAVALLSFGVICFGVNGLAEKVFKLPKTGLAFYILGCIFLPMAIMGIGAFKLFGEWFSFGGDGAALVCAAASGCVAISTFLGVKNYKHPFLAWMSLAATAGTWVCLDAFIMKELSALPKEGKIAVFDLLLLLLAYGATFWHGWQTRRDADSPFGKAAKWFWVPLLFLTALGIATQALGNIAPVTTIIAPIVLAPLFFHRGMIEGKIHVGILGLTVCLLTSIGSITTLSVFAECDGYPAFLFTMTLTSLLLLTLGAIPQAGAEMCDSARVAGYISLIPMALTGSIAAMFSSVVHSKLISFQPLLLGMLILSGIFFLITPKHPLSKETPVCAAFTTMLYLSAVLGMVPANRPLYALLLVAGALLLLVQFALHRSLWTIVLAAASCGAMVLLNVPYPMVWILWMCGAVSLGGVICAHLTKRPLLEKCMAWIAVPMLVTALMDTLNGMLRLPYGIVFLMALALITLLYLLETAAFPTHDRTSGTKPYLEVTSAFAALTTFVIYLLHDDFFDVAAFGDGRIAWGFLLIPMLGVFAVGFLRKKVNLWAAPYLIMIFFTARDMIAEITPERLESWHLPWSMTADTAANLLQAGCFILVLVLFAVMGRILLPRFFDNTDGGTRVDLPLLAGIMPIIAVAATIDWYPTMLFFLFLTVYSLLFIGRTQHRNIPALLASFFGCTTLLIHNVQDPFGILNELTKLNIQTLQILMYLLPFHVFIFTLLLILPEKYRSKVHIARFAMYCVTMLVLLISSMNFGNVADAIILVVFSFAILVGSFAVKRLRWFALGFAVLVTMTIHLTWSFWKSLHWGIYLFLAGLALIVIASVYEYSARYAREHPDAPKKKFTLFAAWKW
ncbi:MAG: hypothetical protein II916_08270 [Oscillospiraceae bacterium]|nr:hypothetical protein [Oscillospiraceae bacterium]